MKTIVDRQAFTKTPTADLAREIDRVLDARYTRDSFKDAPAEEVPGVPFTILKTFIKGFNGRK